MRKPSVFFVAALLALAGFVLTPAVIGSGLIYPFYRNTFFGLILFNLIGQNGMYLPVVIFCLAHMILFGVVIPLALLTLNRKDWLFRGPGKRLGAAVLAVGALVLLGAYFLSPDKATLTGSALVINLLFLFPFALGLGLHAFFLFPAALRELLPDRVRAEIVIGAAALAVLVLVRWSYQRFTGIELPLVLIPAGLCFALARDMVKNGAVVFACFFPSLFMAMLPQKEAIIVPIGSLVLTFLAAFNAAMFTLSLSLRTRAGAQ